MISPLLKNKAARKAVWLDGVGVPTTSEVGVGDTVKISPVEDGVLLLTQVLVEVEGEEVLESTTTLVPWGQITTVEFDGAFI